MAKEKQELEIVAGDPLTDENIYALLQSAYGYIEHKQADARGEMPRRYKQILTMLKATMGKYKHDILDADTDGLSQPKTGGG